MGRYHATETFTGDDGVEYTFHYNLNAPPPGEPERIGKWLLCDICGDPVHENDAITGTEYGGILCSVCFDDEVEE